MTVLRDPRPGEELPRCICGEEVAAPHAECQALSKKTATARDTDPSRSRTRKKREAPLGIAEIAQLLDVKPGTVAQWRQRHIFPYPELTVGGSPAWWANTIIEWAEATGRR